MPADPPVTGTATHVDLDTMAQLDEGLLTPAAERRIRAHVATCPRCSARLQSVVGVRTALAAAPAERLPVEVGARLDAALAHAGRQLAGTDRGAVPFGPRRARWRPNGGLLAAGAAASIVVLLFGALVVGVLRGSGSSDGTAGSGRSQAGGSAAGVPNAVVTASGRDYNATTLRAALPTLLGATGAAKLGVPTAGRDSTAVPAAPGPARRQGAELGPCVAELAGGAAVRPLAVDRARYAGKPATIVVLPEAGRPATLDVWVVGSGCTRGDPQVIYFTRLPRPAGIRSP